MNYRLIGGFIGLLVYHLDKRHRELAISNIIRALRISPAGARLIAKRSFQNLAINIVEFLFQNNPPVQIFGYEHVRRDKGNIFILGHLGNWEVMGRVAVKMGIRLVAVGRDIKNRFINWYIMRRRRISGIEILGKKGSFRRLLSALKEGKSVGILIDQYAGRRGIFVEFLDIPTSTTHSPVLLSLRTGCPVVPVFIIGHKIFIEQPITITRDIKASTQLMVRPLEKYIRMYPEQWWWVHRRWRE